MKVCGVIVTYGDRFHLLSQVIDALYNEGTDQIIIIDNGSSAGTQSGIQKYSANILAYRFEENKGTSLGFKTGIEKAMETECEFIWLLDDDTVPETNSLARLKNFWGGLSHSGKEKNTALCAFRKDRPNFVKAITKNDPNEMLPLKNNFAGFHIKNLFTNIRERVGPGRVNPPGPAEDVIRINAALYGGLFFHKLLIEEAGLPDLSYFLYVDDFDFTYRMTRTGTTIWLVTGSVIHDLENSFYLPGKKKILYHSAFDSPKDSASYYALRNTVHFTRKYLLDNMAIYFLNKVLFTIFIHIIGILRGKWDRLKVIRTAMKDGERGQLGFNPEYKI